MDNTTNVAPYYTIVIPFVPEVFATAWHPTESKGPFKVLTSGSFKYFNDALVWAQHNLGGNPYSIKLVK